MNEANLRVRITGFICNWGAYGALEIAGLNQEQYPACVRLVRLNCLSRLNTGLVLKAFESGAEGVVLLGCPPEQCHYSSGTEQARKVLNQSKQILDLLGISTKRLALLEVPLGEGKMLAEQISRFVAQVKGAEISPLLGRLDIDEGAVRCRE